VSENVGFPGDPVSEPAEGVRFGDGGGVKNSGGAVMFLIFQVLCVFLAAIAMALSLAHALELPGKLRLDKEAYCAAQTIYYPGFTWGGGFGEGLGIMAIFALLLMTPAGSAAFPWTLFGLAGLVATHATYWILTHPVNNFWLRTEKLGALGGGFFDFDPLKQRASQSAANDETWRRFRDRWEFSHVLRAVFSTITLIALIVAVAIR
jgi:hypothetical protein